MRVHGPSREHLDAEGEAFAELVMRGVEQALRVTVKDLKATWTGDDLAVITRVCNRFTVTDLLPWLAASYLEAQTAQRGRLLGTVLTAATMAVPAPATSLAEEYLATASNRLKGFWSVVWEDARKELLTGMENGESIPQLRKRVMQVTGVSKARGTMIARTEVIGAQNRGSLNSMTAAGMPGEKSWLATRDHLTRETHRNAHGQIRKLLASDGDIHFTVGGVSMDGPHDPSAPPRETINCRCTLIYELDEQAATQAVEDGAWEELDEDAAVRRWMQNAPSTMKGYNDSTLRYLIQEEQRKGLVTYAKGDHTVKIMKPGPLVKAKVKRLFATVDELLRDAPPHPGRKVDILVGATGSTKRYRIFGTTALGSHEIVIDRGLLMKNQGPDYFSPVGFMPAARTTDPLVYTL